MGAIQTSGASGLSSSAGTQSNYENNQLSNLALPHVGSQAYSNQGYHPLQGFNYESVVPQARNYENVVPLQPQQINTWRPQAPSLPTAPTLPTLPSPPRVNYQNVASQQVPNYGSSWQQPHVQLPSRPYQYIEPVNTGQATAHAFASANSGSGYQAPIQHYQAPAQTYQTPTYAQPTLYPQIQQRFQQPASAYARPIFTPTPQGTNS